MNFLISQKINTITSTTMITPIHTPASKISPTNSHPVKVMATNANIRSCDSCRFFIIKGVEVDQISDTLIFLLKTIKISAIKERDEPS